MKKCGVIFFSLLALCLALPSQAQTRSYVIEARDAPVADLIRLLAKMQDKNFVVPSNLDGAVTLSFPSVSLNDALNAILESKGLGSVLRNNVVQVSAQKDMETVGQDLSVKIFRLKYASAKDLKSQIVGLVSARGSVLVDERINAITVKDNPNHIKIVSSFIDSIDQMDRQVLIEARMVEATSDFSRSIGIQWGVTTKTGALKFDGVPPGQAGAPVTNVTGAVGGLIPGGTPGAVTPGTPTSALGVPNYILATPAGNPVAALALGLGPFSGTQLDIQLSAAEQEGKIAILSKPSLVTLNNKAATIRSGLKFYVKAPGNITIGSAGSSVGGNSSNLQSITAGISMVITPQITIDDKINLIIDVTESQPDFSKTVDGIPTISDNSATTTVLLEDGQTTIIGGMFQSQKSMTEKGIPFLRRIPILGRLFGSTTENEVKKELLIFIRPEIVREALKKLPDELSVTHPAETPPA